MYDRWYMIDFYLRRSHQRRAPQVNKSFFSSSFSFSNYQILAYNAYFRLYQDHPGVPCDFPGNLASREIWLPGNLTSWEIWLPGKVWPRKCDIPKNVTSWKMWCPGNCGSTGNRIFREMWFTSKCDFPGIWPAGKCDFLGNFSTCEMLVPEKCELTGNLTFR